MKSTSIDGRDGPYIRPRKIFLQTFWEFHEFWSLVFEEKTYGYESK